MEQKQKVISLLENITEVMSIKRFSAKLRSCANYAEETENWLYLEAFLAAIAGVPEEMRNKRVIFWQQGQEYKEISSPKSFWEQKRDRHARLGFKESGSIVDIDYATFVKGAYNYVTDINIIIKISFDGIIVFVKGPMKMLEKAQKANILDKMEFLWPEGPKN